MALSKLIPWIIFGAVLLVMALAFGYFFQQIPTEGNTLAMDWKNSLWPALHAGAPYAEVGLFNPPWIAALLLPFGQLPMQFSWGILAFLTLLILIFSVPRTRHKSLYLLSVILLTLSFPAVRNVVDGNLEALIIAGVLLMLYGYNHDQPVLLALGLLLATTKPQTALLLCVAAAVWMLRFKGLRFTLQTVGVLLLVAVPTLLWRGAAWFNLMFMIREQGSIMDMSLMAALRRAALFPPAINWLLWGIVLALTVIITWLSSRQLSREKAGMLIGASLLLAPYAANPLTLLAVGVIPFFHKRRFQGGLLILLAVAQIALNTPTAIGIYAYYSTGFLLLAWALLSLEVWRTEIRPRQSPHAAAFEPAAALPPKQSF
jgi:hypothetical protein